MEHSQLELLLQQHSAQELDANGQRRLYKALMEDKAARHHAARWMQNDSLLRGELLMGEVANLFAEQVGVPAASECEVAQSFARRAERAAMPMPMPLRRTTGSRLEVPRWLAVAVAISLTALVLTNSWLLWHDRGPMIRGLDNVANLPLSQQVHGQLIDTTVCVWGATDGITPIAGQRLVEGDSFQLLEGIAKIALTYGEMEASLEVEGPAAIMLARGGVPNLRYGKITLDVTGPSGGSFPLEAAFGQVLTQTGSETGVVSFGSRGQVHVFAGGAGVRSAWLAPDDLGPPQIDIEAGQAITLSNVGGHSLRSTLTKADRNLFTPTISMGADYLRVTPQYVRTVEAAAPVGYWRFEQGAGDSGTANHLPGGRPLEVEGDVKWVGPEGNQAVEFGMSPNAGWLVASGDWNETLAGEFSIELWMKPSHYHYGAMLGFAGPYDPVRRLNSYGIGIELGGTYLANSYQRPRQVRCFYRAPLGIMGGASTYSGEANEYRARQWQHVVTVFRGSELELYLDGELVDRVPATGPTPKGLQLLLGQLYTGSVSRPFVGDLDEVALYNRALETTEIKHHFDLLRSPDSEEASPPKAPLEGTAQHGHSSGAGRRFTQG